MKLKAVAVCALAVGLAAVPLAPASAHDHHYFRGPGLFFGLFAAGAAVAAGAVALATAPLAIVAGAGPRGYYGPAYGPGRGYYAPPPSYYGGAGYYGGPAYYAPPAAYGPSPYVVQPVYPAGYAVPR